MNECTASKDQMPCFMERIVWAHCKRPPGLVLGEGYLGTLQATRRSGLGRGLSGHTTSKDQMPWFRERVFGGTLQAKTRRPALGRGVWGHTASDQKAWFGGEGCLGTLLVTSRPGLGERVVWAHSKRPAGLVWGRGLSGHTPSDQPAWFGGEGCLGTLLATRCSALGRGLSGHTTSKDQMPCFRERGFGGTLQATRRPGFGERIVWAHSKRPDGLV